MKNLLLAFILAFICWGCKQSAIQKSFSGADSLVIHFKGEQAGVIKKTVETTDGAAIRKTIDFIDAKETESSQCDYDGKMFFYKKGEQLQEVDYKMKDKTCNRFSFLLNGKLINTRMSNEAIDFFNSLEEGKLWY